MCNLNRTILNFPKTIQGEILRINRNITNYLQKNIKFNTFILFNIYIFFLIADIQNKNLTFYV